MTDAKFHVLAVKGSNPQVREYKKRRFHAKDRLGCFQCKAKKVKCDQAKPVCARCSRSPGSRCQYQEVGYPSASSKLDEPRVGFSVQAAMPSWASIVANTILQPHLRAIGLGTPATRQTPVHALLYHAANNLDTVFGKPLEPALWDLTCQHPHLLASILAVSACDMRLHAPADPLPHRIAERSLLSVALRLFQPALEQPLSQTRSDALLLTSMLLNHLAVASVDADEGSPAAYGLAFCGCSGLGRDAFGWLALSMGLKPLLMATEAFREESVLLPIFQASGDQDQTFPPPQDSLDHIPAAWSRLTSGIGCLQEPIRSLAGIRALPPSPQNALGYTQFVGTLEPEFLQLLYGGDGRAIWALGYWLGLMGHLDTSWFRGRVRRDGAAIRSFLLSSGVCRMRGEDGAMWRQLMHDYDCIYTSASST